MTTVMQMTSSTMFGIVLAVAMFSTGMVVDRLIPVYVTNFPLDNQGNIRVTQMNREQNVSVTNFPIQQPEPSWKAISIVENFNLTWTPELSGQWVYSAFIDLGSGQVGGYSKMKLYIKVTNYTRILNEPNAVHVNVYYASVYDYGEIYRGASVQLGWDWHPSAPNLFYEYPAGESTMREIIEPSLRIYVQGSSYTPNAPVPSTISCLVSIGIYMRNE